jgi:adenine-specific DNA methylase
MTRAANYPKRLIEVDLPIKKISEHARREKSIRHGHISTLHIWWARRPLAACRAVICGALWLDPADPLCPDSFKTEAKKQMAQFWNTVDTTARNVDNPLELRQALLDFIADFSNWDNSTDERYLNTARALTQSAHEALGGEPGTRPLVVDPFAGGGSIPLEALRVGADAYASDLNPVAVLLNKVVLEYIPKYGPELADEVRKWGQWVKEEAEKELAEFYPKDPDGATPIAYLWARTIRCEGPGCGAEVPLIRSLWLAKKGSRSVALKLIPNPAEKRIDFEILHDPKVADVWEGTVKRGSATCPCCGYTTSVQNVRNQLSNRGGGTNESRLYCKVVKNKYEETEYRLPTQQDFLIVQKSQNRIKELEQDRFFLPTCPLPPDGALGFRIQKYGFIKWEDIFSYRQKLLILSYIAVIKKISIKGKKQEQEKIVKTILGLNLSKNITFSSSLCIWRNVRTCVAQTFGRPTLSMIWDYGEMNPFFGSAGDFSESLSYMVELIEYISKSTEIQGKSQIQDAANTSLPDDITDFYCTDPPYYDAIPYAHLSKYFFAIFKELEIFEDTQDAIQFLDQNECIADEQLGKDRLFFERKMTDCLLEGRRISKPNGIGLIVFAHKSTKGWETQLQAMINADWVITASWPIDTERPGRLRAQDSAALASSIHLVCRPRENPNGQVREEIGEWSDILAELPLRIKEWMPRLKQENVVGADAIFACLGPALEIFSRYSRVEKASGEQVMLKEYLEKVWEAVEKEALTMIFEGADASGFEEDARLTAMWLWTLKGKLNGSTNGKETPSSEKDEDEEIEEDDVLKAKPSKVTGYALEFDAARKISQGLGAHLEAMPTLVEIKKGNARLLSVAERASYLFGKQELAPKRKLKKREAQMTLFPGEVKPEESVSSGTLGELSSIGKTSLDRVHQSMLLFGNGQSDALKRFLVEEGIGKDPQFKKLAQALVALYPVGSDEKRWAEGVMSRMKGLGL